MKSQKIIISNLQFSTLVVLFTVGSSILIIPRKLAEAAEQDAWISAILTVIIGLVLVTFYSKIAGLHPDKHYFDCVKHILGKWLGGFVIAITYIFFFFLSVLVLWNIGDFLKTQILVNTPITVIFILFMMTVIFGVRAGLESIARSSEIFIPWILSLMFLTVIFLIGSLETENLLPVFEGGIQSIVYGSYYFLSFPFLELLTFLMITPYVKTKKRVKHSFMEGVLIGGLVLTIAITFCILVLGADFTERNSFPFYVLGKKVTIADILERVEVFIAIIWFLSIYFKLAVTVYVLTSGLQSIFKLKDYRPLTLPIGMLIIVTATLMFSTTMKQVEFSEVFFYPFTYIVCLVIPTTVYITGLIKQKRKRA
ncbi:GerAB/ArcD/ProY family transporter [Aquibacillus salsiterrae]|uniref:Spore germination protein n=1 Tax=Aquibacillus salsiterrae TaxID=2950439 RepID=A0A9X3WCJ1_9BACI|nr:endospore germination permease [Aquibacillus salsiterrae]MDC3415866.1 spore germination protein [Aquibacillus salsiterrae]